MVTVRPLEGRDYRHNCLEYSQHNRHRHISSKWSNRARDRRMAPCSWQASGQSTHCRLCQGDACARRCRRAGLPATGPYPESFKVSVRTSY